MQCPFVYSDGRECAGEVSHGRAYGRHDRYGLVQERDIRKVRLWCSEKGDHAGAVGSFVTKERMEFYPDELIRRGIYDAAVAKCDNAPRKTTQGEPQ